MHNTYISSTVSLRCRGSLYWPLNDSSCYLNDRFDKYPYTISSHSSLPCCPCCDNSIYKVPIYLNSLYGLRQSTLIYCSHYKQLIFGGVNKCYIRFPVSYVDKKCCYEKSYCFKERSVGGRKGLWGKGRYGCIKGNCEREHLCDVDEAEVMLSLLSEDVGEECFCRGERTGRSSRRVEVQKRGNDGGNCYVNEKKNADSGVLESTSKCKYELKLEKRGNNGGATCKSRRKNVGAGALGSKSKCEYESDMLKSREEGKGWKNYRREEEREQLLSGEHRRPKVRKDGSSCSSFYSFSSTGEWGSDNEVEMKHEGYEGESSTEYQRDLRKDGEIANDEKLGIGVEKHGSYAEEHGVPLKRKNIPVGSNTTSSGAEFDWRKQSEKQLTEVSTEEIGSQKESSQRQSRFSKVYESGYNDRKEKSNVVVKIDDGMRRRYSKTAESEQVTGQSESNRKYKQFMEVSEVHESNVEATSSSLKRHSGRDDNLTASVTFVQDSRGEHSKTAGHNTREGEYRRNSQQTDDVLESQEVSIRGISSSRRQSETMKNKREESSATILISAGDTEEKHHQSGQRITRHVDSRGKSQQLSEISDTHGLDVDSMFISRNQSDTRVNKQEEIYSRSGTVSDTHKVTEKHISFQERNSTTEMKSVEESRKGSYITDGTVLRIGSREEAQTRSEMLSFHQDMSQEASSSQAPLRLNIESRVRSTGVVEGNKRSSEAVVVVAPSSQLGVRVPQHVEARTEFATQEVSNEGQSGSSALHVRKQTSSPALQQEIYGMTHGEPSNFISHGNVLGSAEWFQKSSVQFVDEFVERVRHEVSTSEIHETKLVYEKKQKRDEASQYGSRDSQPKEDGLMHSSRTSGIKGPCDEIWDVTDPSIQEPAKTEAPEGTTKPGNAVVKRTGRTLWNIIADIVHLPWTSNSSRRSSPNKSTSSEAWFSVHEPDENSDENGKKERRTMSQDTAVGKQHLETISDRSPEGSSMSNLKDIRKRVGMDSLSSSSVMESGSASKAISLTSSEETFGKNEGTSSGTAIATSSLPLPAIRIKSLVIEEISEAGKTNTIGSGTMVQPEEPVLTGLTRVSGTEGKDGELKGRKLKRTDQVIKDRFDEWEEAYTLENEQRKIDEMFMREALMEAQKAADSWEVPVGAVLVHNGNIIARGFNLVEELRDSTAHAEMICIREASNILRTWRLSETTLYVTLEPCPMCAGAILQARVDTVVWGAPNKLLGADGSWIRLFPNGDGGNGSELTDKPAAPVHPFHPKIKIRRGVLASECADAMKQFFQLRRKKKDAKSEPPTPPSCLPISNHPAKFFTKMHDAFNLMFCL